MNDDTLVGETRDITGKVKEVAGDVTGDSTLEGEGLADQIVGKMQKIAGATRETFVAEGQPLADAVIRFARTRPFAAAAIAGVVLLAVLNTFRGKR